MKAFLVCRPGHVCLVGRAAERHGVLAVEKNPDLCVEYARFVGLECETEVEDSMLQQSGQQLNRSMFLYVLNGLFDIPSSPW